MLNMGIDAHKNILMPVYQLDPRLKIKRDAQVDFVSKEVYMEVGYDGIVSENS